MKLNLKRSWYISNIEPEMPVQTTKAVIMKLAWMHLLQRFNVTSARKKYQEKNICMRVSDIMVCCMSHIPAHILSLSLSVSVSFSLSLYLSLSLSIDNQSISPSLCLVSVALHSISWHFGHCY